jgi:hypothetical protein
VFRRVAALTGSKNAVKGMGSLLGTVLLGLMGFVPSVLAMAGVLALILLAVALLLAPGLPAGRKGARFREVWSKSRDVNLLSAARMFLFGTRDVWFVVGLPLFFSGVWSDGTPAGNRAAFFQIGTFMAVWIIGYGIVQAFAPTLLRAATRPLSEIRGLTAADRVTMDVGFCDMSNAAGRLLGTLLSAISYERGGLACLATAALMAALSGVLAARLARPEDPAVA